VFKARDRWEENGREQYQAGATPLGFAGTHDPMYAPCNCFCDIFHIAEQAPFVPSLLDDGVAKSSKGHVAMLITYESRLYFINSKILIQLEII
jgi:hypothetical protein